MTTETDSERVLKYEWPGMPELKIESLRVVEEISPDIFGVVKRKFIVEAIDMSGGKWKGTEPPRIPGISFPD